MCDDLVPANGVLVCKQCALVLRMAEGISLALKLNENCYHEAASSVLGDLLQFLFDRNDGHDEDELDDEVAFDDDVETDEIEECRRLSEEM